MVVKQRDSQRSRFQRWVGRMAALSQERGLARDGREALVAAFAVYGLRPGRETTHGGWQRGLSVDRDQRRLWAGRSWVWAVWCAALHVAKRLSGRREPWHGRTAARCLVEMLARAGFTRTEIRAAARAHRVRIGRKADAPLPRRGAASRALKAADRKERSRVRRARAAEKLDEAEAKESAAAHAYRLALTNLDPRAALVRALRTGTLENDESRP